MKIKKKIQWWLATEKLSDLNKMEIICLNNNNHKTWLKMAAVAVAIAAKATANEKGCKFQPNNESVVGGEAASQPTINWT